MEEDVSGTIRNSGGSYGGGAEVLVVCTRPVQSHDNRTGNDDAVLRTYGSPPYAVCIRDKK